ncbi:ROK family transcriptional regulator [Micromonospora sp. WMMD882]|uniref:ROK family transcriptional regulator n=1 Tax=Micromonospora sp. WMMD882 TaxID=3015151 RepID=UPI00248CD073|nr:ROK family transcriptional regulator [Micromonospora sp. WMMD882]WBB79890.1 ROK family transcriptional regulator [Micromonospora sp. WMMD882]
MTCTDEAATTAVEGPETPARRGLPGRVRSGEKVRPEQVRVHNRELLLRTLYREGPHSRADLARRTGLTRVSVSDVVGELLADDLVVEVGVRSGTRPGKPAMMLEFHERGHQTIALDLSHSTLYRGAVLDLGGTVVARQDVEIAGSAGDDALAKVVGLVGALREQVTAPLLGVGVGTPGIVDVTGVVLSAPNLGWKDLGLRAALAERFSCPVVVANDANATALAERSYGRSAADTLLIRVGVGVGAGLLLDGVPVLGSRFAAGEIGHVVVDVASERQCVCGKAGCLETWLSTRRIQDDLSHARTDAERDGVLAGAGESLGIVLAPIVAALNVSEIVLSGPRRVLEGPLAEAVMETIRRRALTEVHGDIVLRLSDLGDDIVLRGAAAMVMGHELGLT